MSSLAGRTVAIVSRIYGPEPGAASFRLSALSRALRDAGANVAVLTTTPPLPYVPAAPIAGIDVKRFPVLRDRAGYVRGYVHYMSFDIPAFFRLLFAARCDVVVVEPPPTTGVVVRVAAALRRTPYVYYAADVWSEAVAETSAPRWVGHAVRRMEKFAYDGATAILAVSDDVADRVRSMSPDSHVTTVGNGVDDDTFGPDGAQTTLADPYLLYVGTASEVHGAGIFVEAMPEVLRSVPRARLVFVGQGAERDRIATRAAQIAPGTVTFEPRVSPDRAAEWIRGAAATLASTVPGGYVAFPTKMLASAACGTRVVYAGGEPGRAFAQEPGVGWAADYDSTSVAAAMSAALSSQHDESQRRALSRWTRDHHSLRVVAARAAEVVAEVANRRDRKGRRR
jgi:glycosyltransferase involved in cell wall biosynthesis